MGEFYERVGRGLTLYVRYLAWLHATPTPPEGAPPSKIIRPRISRIEQIKKDGGSLEMPPNPAPHLIRHLIELGITQSSGMGPVPLSWNEIAQWQSVTGVTLASWEARLIRQLSTAYISEGRKAECETCAAPWKREITKQERDLDEARLRLVLG